MRMDMGWNALLSGLFNPVRMQGALQAEGKRV
jgi:hypothetical protein